MVLSKWCDRPPFSTDVFHAPPPFVSFVPRNANESDKRRPDLRLEGGERETDFTVIVTDLIKPHLGCLLRCNHKDVSKDVSE